MSLRTRFRVYHDRNLPLEMPCDGLDDVLNAHRQSIDASCFNQCYDIGNAAHVDGGRKRGRERCRTVGFRGIECYAYYCNEVSIYMSAGNQDCIHNEYCVELPSNVYG